MKKLIIAGIVGLMLGLAGQKLIAFCSKCYLCSGSGQRWEQCFSCRGAGGEWKSCYSCNGRGENCY